MPEIIPDHVPSPRTLLAWDGTVYRPVSIDAAGRLQVRGEDQLISFGGALASLRQVVVSGAGGWIASNAVPAGTIWHVTHICAWDVTSPTTAHTYFFRHDGANHRLHIETAAFAADQGSYFSCDFWMDPVDEIRVTYAGSLVGDTCGIDLIGHIMTLET